MIPFLSVVVINAAYQMVHFLPSLGACDDGISWLPSRWWDHVTGPGQGVESESNVHYFFAGTGMSVFNFPSATMTNNSLDLVALPAWVLVMIKKDTEPNPSQPTLWI